MSKSGKRIIASAKEALRVVKLPRAKKPMARHEAYFTFDQVAYREHGYCLYYFAPVERTAGPYRRQRHVTAIIDIAEDGTLAGVELIDDMPKPTRAALSPEQP